MEDKVVLVTGSGRGFGRSMAIAYANAGASVIGCSRTVSELTYLEDYIKSRKGEIFTHPVDLADEESILTFRDIVLERYGRLDCLVNNAASSLWKTFEDITIKDWDFTFDVNIRAPFILSKLFLETMIKQGGGSIINISSKSAEMGFIAEIGYCPSKYAIEGFTQCLAMELKQYNIAVNSLNVSSPPGKRLKPTEMTQKQADQMPVEVRQQYADDELMVKKFQEAWVFLALQNGSGVTGVRFGTKELTDYLNRNGWDAAKENWIRKLTKAVYVNYDLPKSVKYQTPEGGLLERCLFK